MVGSFPRAQGRQLEGSWAPIQLSCCLLVSWISPPATILPHRLKKHRFIPTVSGRQGQASKFGLLHLGAPQEFLSPQKGGLWLLFVLASY